MNKIAAGDHDFITTCAGVGRKRIANIYMSAGDDCPNGWHKDTYDGVSFCRLVNNHYCAYNFSTNGTSYQRVYGRAGYQKGWAASFFLDITLKVII